MLEQPTRERKGLLHKVQVQLAPFGLGLFIVQGSASVIWVGGTLVLWASLAPAKTEPEPYSGYLHMEIMVLP